MSFSITAADLHWIDGSADDPEDRCLHGHAAAFIAGRKLEYDATVSATALVLLKTLTEDHILGEDIQMLPCCGHSLFANEDLSGVEIGGCPYGIDWTVRHKGDAVELELEDGTTDVIAFEDYRAEVFRFADSIEAFYRACTPKPLPDSEWDRNGYLAFWNEWRRRRNG